VVAETFRNTHPSLRRCWHPVALEGDVPAAEPLGVRVLGERWVLARLGGRIVGLRDRCPHRLVPLSAGRIVDDELECAYHGYRFDASGRTTAVPALAPETPIPPKACVDTAQVTVKFGLVWICLADDPIDDIIDDAGYLDPVNDCFVAGPFTTRVGAAILTDNFLDAAHFPYLHAKTFGARDDGRPTLTVSREGWRLRQLDRQVVDGAHLEEAVDSAAEYVVGLPFSVELRIDRPDGSDFIWSFVCPVDDDTSVWWMVHAYPLSGDEQQIAGARDLQVAVGVEDLWILEQMEDPNIPLDVRAEVHTRADLGCLEYRRMLGELAATA
jgi:phenylpropionate dioxygenase-like ring-hydroxylating dioxygenase large terminal subunit